MSYNLPLKALPKHRQHRAHLGQPVGSQQRLPDIRQALLDRTSEDLHRGCARLCRGHVPIRRVACRRNNVVGSRGCSGGDIEGHHGTVRRLRRRRGSATGGEFGARSCLRCRRHGGDLGDHDGGAGVPGAGLLGFIALIIALRQFGALLIEADQKRLTATSCAAHGRASAPTIPQRVETMRGRKALTSTALPQRSAPLPGCPGPTNLPPER